MKTDFSAPTFIQTMIAPTTQELAEEKLLGNKHNKGSQWLLDDSLSPADLYIYLKARFGPPNGVSMILRSPNTDNLIQWHYTLKSNSTYLDILELNTRTELWVSDYPDLSVNDWNQLILAFKKDFSRIGKNLKEIRDNLEKWQLFYNPYYRLEKIVKRYEKELSEILKQPLKLPPEPKPWPSSNANEQTIDEFRKQFKAVSNYYVRAGELSTSLRLICPVWAEAFINFIIFFLSRDEIKKDARLYQDFLRKEIDVRVKLLHLNCLGFNNPIDSTQQIYKDFHSLMNERNDLLHGNIEPNKLSYETVYFDGTIPLFTETQGIARNTLGVSLSGIEPAETLERVNIVRSFIKFILGHLDKPYSVQLESILNKRDLGWRPQTNRIGILFSDYIPEIFVK